jgi:acyl-CoA reductase-like NAD-dependent aldehyde dehydrogenase
MQLDEQKMADLVSRVVARLQQKGVAAPLAAPAEHAHSGWTRSRAPHGEDRPIQRKNGAAQAPLRVPTAKSPESSAPAVLKSSSVATGDGVYLDVDQACRAAERSYQELSRLGFNARFALIETFRKIALANIERWSAEAARETGMGRAEDKIKKNRLVTTRTPGPEFLMRPDTYAGSDGLTTMRLDPWGVIASIIPCTNSTETIINNGISMLSAGNAVVFNPHPVAKKVSCDAVRTINQGLSAAGFPRELLCVLAEPTVESANALMRHPITGMVLVTGGGAVVEAAMKSGKRAVCAGPGNPPAVVDETADLDRAARALVSGASLDNNVVCTDEKGVLAVASIADTLKKKMLENGCVEVTGENIDKLTKIILSDPGSPTHHGMTNKKFVGKNPSVILREIGMNVDDRVRLAIVDVDKNHPMIWTEQLMPVLPICRLKDADEAIAFATAVEGNRRHTASIHSQRLDRITRFANTMNCSICVVNDANYAGLGLNGEGYTSFSIATPTGEGLTTARTFCRERRLAVCGGGLNRS